MNRTINTLKNDLAQVQNFGVVVIENQIDLRDSHTIETCNEDVAKHLYEKGYRRIGDIDNMIDWCRKKMREEKTEPYGLRGKRLEGYEQAMKAVMSYLHGLKGAEK